MISEVIPYGTSYVTNNAGGTWGNPTASNLQSNLHEVRLTFRWPLAKGTNAPGRQVYRTLAGGSLVQTNELVGGPPLYFFESRTYVQAKAP